MSQNERIIRLLGEVSTPETSENYDPYGDDGGEFDSDVDYCPSIVSIESYAGLRYLPFCKSDARQNGQAEVLEFYDENHKLHFINVTPPKLSELIFLQSRRTLDSYARFWLYTRKNENEFEELYIDGIKNSTYFNPINPLIIITHGWLSSGNSDSTQLIKNAFLETRDVNVIIVDWVKDAAHNYLKSAYSTMLVGNKIRDMVLTLSRTYCLSGENLHLIGHSLGAHVVGLAGNKLRRQKFFVGRVTGLDPARPFFELIPIFAHITNKSAEFVDIIHTDAGLRGYQSRIGHVDFYPNGGILQPHCCGSFVFSRLLPASCEHSCSYIYFKEAIRGNRYLCTRCNSYLPYVFGLCDHNDKQIIGLPSTAARGSYFVTILH